MRETLNETDDMFLRITQGAPLDEILATARRLGWNDFDLWDLARYHRATRRLGDGHREVAKAGFGELLQSKNEYVRYYSQIFYPLLEEDGDL